MSKIYHQFITDRRKSNLLAQDGIFSSSDMRVSSLRTRSHVGQKPPSMYGMAYKAFSPIMPPVSDWWFLTSPHILAKMPSASFTQKIYELAKKIPKGRVTTYKILAESSGTKAYRAVGNAMRCNPSSPVVPCHRVVNSNGAIGGFLGKINPNSREVRRKIKMLRKEGIKIENNKIVDFESVLINLI